MTYIFVFLGEFGYELMNWQGVIRKFKYTCNEDDYIISCSRSDLYPFYEECDEFIDISNNTKFKNSIACGYVGMVPEYNQSHTCIDINSPLKDFYPQFNTKEDLEYDKQLKKDLKQYIISRLNDKYKSEIRFIFSSENTLINGCKFGCDRLKFDFTGKEGDIYEHLELNNNYYKKILCDETVYNKVKSKTDIINKPYILIQDAQRDIVKRSSSFNNKEMIIKEISSKYYVILISFNTGRNKDSFSKLSFFNNTTFEYVCNSFAEQAYLISKAKSCVFFTEGDFRSHIYVPPFLGKDVFSIAPKNVYELKTSPIDFWNKNVYRFGGQIISYTNEELQIDICMEELINRM